MSDPREQLAVDLDGVGRLTDDLLHEAVISGACMAPMVEPTWADVGLTDRKLAAQMCAGCPVRNECLELVLRNSGEDALGVWGGLAAEDVRELHPVWRARRRGGELA